MFSKAGSLERAERLYERAEFLGALSELRDLPGMEPLVLRLRVLICRGALREARVLVESSQRVVLNSDSHPLRATFWMLAATAYHRLNDRAKMYAAFSAARGYAFCVDSPDLAGELAHYEALVALRENDVDEAERLILPAFSAPSRSVRAWAHSLCAMNAAARKQLDAQLGHLEDAWLTIEEEVAVNQFQAAQIVLSILALAVETGRHGIVAQAADRYDAVRWNADLAYYQHQILRILGWGAALRGDHLNAFRLWLDAAACAPSAPRQLAAIVDRAFLARELDQPTFAGEELAAAQIIAEGIEWNETCSDERLALLALACVCAKPEPALGVRLLGRYRDLQGTVSAHANYGDADELRTGVESFGAGTVALLAGDRTGARTLLARAFAVFEDAGLIRRATQAALQLAALDGGAASPYLAYARAKVPCFPDSWLARQLDAVDRCAGEESLACAGK